MAHECEQCGQECYCDMDDCGGFEQPSDCPHLSKPGHCDASDESDDYEVGLEQSHNQNGYGQ